MSAALDKLAEMERRHTELQGMLGDPEIINDQRTYQKIAKEFSHITPAVEAYGRYRDLQKQIEDLSSLIKTPSEDRDLVDMAKTERAELLRQAEEMEPELHELAFPKVEEKDRDLIFEIRAGTGGQEASLFAADLFRMYSRYAESKGWTVEVMSSHESETGGFKEIVFGISGSGASKRLKWEGGAHRVQRVPATETQGRIHTSAATVAVLFEPEEVDIQIDPKDLKIDVFRSSGPGGQSVNTTDSAIRITHEPSGLVVICQDERSQLKNKDKAMRVLRARLLEKTERENQNREAQDRKVMVGSGDRSEKIRTYNYPERRVTDHRIGLTLYKLPNIMEGDLEDVTEALIRAEEEKRTSDGN
ncbi:MAG: peptide chain release factor 1 [Candidatus Omnitrophota bacterium]